MNDDNTQAPYQRSRDGKRRNTADDTGMVAVTILLRDRTAKGMVKKGNISRTIAVPNARVSDVARYIENALFGEDK